MRVRVGKQEELIGWKNTRNRAGLVKAMQCRYVGKADWWGNRRMGLLDRCKTGVEGTSRW